MTYVAGVFPIGKLMERFGGKVNGFDFLKWQLGMSPNPFSALDLATWEANYGTTVTPLSASSAAIPEPTTCTLALAALCLVVSRRR